MKHVHRLMFRKVQIGNVIFFFRFVFINKIFCSLFCYLIVFVFLFPPTEAQRSCRAEVERV